MLFCSITSPSLLFFPLRLLKNPRPSPPLRLKPMSWSCSKCTFLNPPSQKHNCQICLSPSSPPPSSSSSSSSSLTWPCKACTFSNPLSSDACDVCGTSKPLSSLSNFEDLDPIVVDDDLDDSSIGSVFFPLKRCNKRKTVEGRSEDSDGFRDLGISRCAKSSRNEGALLDSEVNVECVKNAEETARDAGSSKLKIMSYNVWFREDLEMYKRMKALGELIQQHSPDVICFQEVTPNIYGIFEQSNWWKTYRCSVSNVMANTRPYFCMQVSKLPVKSFNSKPFGNSVMGRELCVAEIEVGMGKTLVVATTHLESPCPAPPTWDQMYSKERVAQAKEAVSVLNRSPNIIFAGDMNWDDAKDGQFPLLDGWTDAWTELRPGERGYTYDTKTNQMLTGNRTLQKRLDRFLCNLKDFEISEIDMIGTDAIPGLSYCKEKKIKNEVKKLMLPVLPSDHYGLLVNNL
ncbi:hypothetical protein Syun_010024 [Stephania yunnanensis]|uniref:RanBP2-type domain-containing protein n=1 Tax=Stephania yunnanensis TaxID=152371 RepID=A0AAP0KGR5_9MAGN